MIHTCDYLMQRTILRAYLLTFVFLHYLLAKFCSCSRYFNASIDGEYLYHPSIYKITTKHLAVVRKSSHLSPSSSSPHCVSDLSSASSASANEKLRPTFINHYPPSSPRWLRIYYGSVPGWILNGGSHFGGGF